MDKNLEQVVLKEPVEENIYAAARSSGMLTMREDAIVKALAGEIPFEEIIHRRRAFPRRGKRLTENIVYLFSMAYHIYLVDDDRFLLDLYSIKFKNAGHEVSSFW